MATKRSILYLMSAVALSAAADNVDLSQYVNPLIGTLGYGNVYP